MFLNLLSFAVPVLNYIKIFPIPEAHSTLRPRTPSNEEITRIVRALATRILEAEKARGAGHAEMVDALIERDQTVEAFVHNRLRVVQADSEGAPALSETTEEQVYIAVRSDLRERGAIPFFVAREISHLLHDDSSCLYFVTTVASAAAATLSVFVCGWSLIPSLAATALAQGVAYLFYARGIEKSADDFAIHHTVFNEQMAAAGFFSRAGAQSSHWSRIVAALFPSDAERIAAIRAQLARYQGPSS
jgi:Zn-dependent protease with chaperone function